jgi:uncharacterized protein YkwD
MTDDYINTINLVRALHGQRLLSYSGPLQKWAMNHARRVASTKFLWHPKNGGSGNEIAARGQTSIQEAIQSWLDSPGHRAILLGDYTQCGVAMVVSPRNGQAVWFAQFE